MYVEQLHNIHRKRSIMAESSISVLISRIYLGFALDQECSLLLGKFFFLILLQLTTFKLVFNS